MVLRLRSRAFKPSSPVAPTATSPRSELRFCSSLGCSGFGWGATGFAAHRAAASTLRLFTGAGAAASFASSGAASFPASGCGGGRPSGTSFDFRRVIKSVPFSRRTRAAAKRVSVSSMLRTRRLMAREARNQSTASRSRLTISWELTGRTVSPSRPAEGGLAAAPRALAGAPSSSSTPNVPKLPTELARFRNAGRSPALLGGAGAPPPMLLARMILRRGAFGSVGARDSRKLLSDTRCTTATPACEMEFLRTAWAKGENGDVGSDAAGSSAAKLSEGLPA